MGSSFLSPACHLILSAPTVSTAWLLSLRIHFLLHLFCLPVITVPLPLLFWTLHYNVFFSGHLFTKATFHSLLHAFNIKKCKRDDQNKRLLLLLWSKMWATLYRYSTAPVTKYSHERIYEFSHDAEHKTCFLRKRWHVVAHTYIHSYTNYISYLTVNYYS